MVDQQDRCEDHGGAEEADPPGPAKATCDHGSPGEVGRNDTTEAKNGSTACLCLTNQYLNCIVFSSAHFYPRIEKSSIF